MLLLLLFYYYYYYYYYCFIIILEEVESSTIIIIIITRQIETWSRNATKCEPSLYKSRQGGLNWYCKLLIEVNLVPFNLFINQLIIGWGSDVRMCTFNDLEVWTSWTWPRWTDLVFKHENKSWIMHPLFCILRCHSAWMLLFLSTCLQFFVSTSYFYQFLSLSHKFQFLTKTRQVGPHNNNNDNDDNNKDSSSSSNNYYNNNSNSNNNRLNSWWSPVRLTHQQIVTQHNVSI